METTQTGVSADPETNFQGLWDSGAFEPTKELPQAENPAPEPEVQAKEPEAKEPEAKEETPEPEEKPEAKPEEEPEEYATLEDMLRAQKIDPESVKSLPVTVKIDGKEQLVPLSEVLKSYQLEGHVNNKSIELSNAQKQFAAEAEAARTLVRQQLEQTQNLGNLAMQQLNHEFNQINWQELRVTNPGQYAALLTDYQGRQNQIQNHLGQINQQQAQIAQQNQQALQQRFESEKQVMLNKHPEWRDPTALKGAQEKMLSYARSVGFTDAELSQVYDHRFMAILHDAASQAALQAAQPETLKRVREAPKMAKAGTRQNTDPANASKQKAIERFNANPRDVDAQAALFSVLAA